MTPIRITLPYPPSANVYWRHVGHKVLISREAREYRKSVAYIARGLQPFKGDVSMTLDVYRPKRIGDVSNRIKVLEDSLRGWAYVDDSQVAELHVKRHEDKDNPRVEVVVTEMRIEGEL